MATSKRESGLISWESTGAGSGVRTRGPKLGKLVLCQLSYARISSRSIIPGQSPKPEDVHGSPLFWS